MENPWLSIPASDYEEHMGEAGAQQLAFLSEQFKGLIETHRPKRIAILGCATGNGFEHLRAEPTELVVGIDINPEYVEITRTRFQTEIPGLELYCSDIANLELESRLLDLVSCGLFFEHVDPEVVFAKVARWLKAGGVLGTVLQLPVDSGLSVSDTGVESMKALEPVSRLVAPKRLKELAEKAGFREEKSETVTLQTGKSFCVLTYRLIGCA